MTTETNEPSFLRRDGAGRLVDAWCVEPLNYEAGFARGKELARELVRFLRDNPNHTGRNLLGRVILSPKFQSERHAGSRTGFLVGIASALAAGGE